MKPDERSSPPPLPDYVPYGISLCTFCARCKTFCPVHDEHERLGMTEREELVKRTWKGNVKSCKVFRFPKSRVVSFLAFIGVLACLFISGEMTWWTMSLRIVGLAICGWLCLYTNPDADVDGRWKRD